MKKAISILLSVVIAFSVLVPGLNGLEFATVKAEAASANAGDAYATLLTTSDLQQQNYLKTVKSIMTQITDGGVADTPDALLFGGDFQTTSNSEQDISHHMDHIEDLFNDFYPYYHSENLVYIKGNHDALNERHYETGLHEFDNFFVYVINEADYRAGNLNDAKTASANLRIALDRLLATSNDKPVFVMTHVPFHHNSRGGYAQSAYGRYLFEVLNDYGRFMDIVFMFGHNHSDKYDDYIGGSVNYLGVGDTIYISSYDGKDNLNHGETYFTPETLNFTYMNYGYGAYAKNTEGTIVDTVHGIGEVKSTNTLTMGVLEICPDRIVVSRYSPDGKYGASEVITRKTPSNKDGSYDEPHITLADYGDNAPGTQYAVYANVAGFNNPKYSWTSSNSSLIRVTGNSNVAQVTHLTASNTPVTITVTVSEADGSVTRSASCSLKTTGTASSTAGAGILLGDSNVSGQKLEFYNIEFPYQLNLVGHFSGATNVTSQSWGTSNASVATVDNGLVTFADNGDVTITYTVVNNGTTHKISTDFTVSNGAKQELVFEQATSFEDGETFAIVMDYKKTSYYALNGTTYDASGNNSENTEKHIRIYPAGESVALLGEAGSYHFDGLEAVSWIAEESDTPGSFYLKHSVLNKYLNVKWADRENLSTGEMMGPGYWYMTSALEDTPKSTWVMHENYGVYCDSESTALYSQSGKYATLNNTTKVTSNPVRANCPPLLFKQTGVIEEHIELGGDFVEGTSQTVYNVTDRTAVKAYGTYTNYGRNVVETWDSTNRAVATIDADGNIDFTGVAGDTKIIYKIKSDTVGEKTLDFTLKARTGKETARTFRYVKELAIDKPYVFVYKSDITAGEGFALSTNKLTEKAMMPKEITVKENAVGDYLYVEIPESDADDFVWTTGGKSSDFVFISTEKSILYSWWNDTDGDGEINFDTEMSYTKKFIEGTGEFRGVKNDTPTSQYLGAKITGYGAYGVEGELFTVPYGEIKPLIDAEIYDLTPHMFHLKRDELYNDYKVSVSASNGSYSGYTAVGYHSSYYFGIGGLNSSYSQELMAFEEVFPNPTAVIESNYEYIGKRVTRNEISPRQTEQLVANAQNFPNGIETITWNSSDPSVATIDENGLLTYTGRVGVTDISLTVTVTNDVDGTVTDTQSVSITVNADQFIVNKDYFYETDNFVVNNQYVLVHQNNEYTDTDDGQNAWKNDNKYYAISSGRYSDNVSKAEVTTVVPSIRDYIEAPSETTVWTAVDSGVDGYVHLVDQNGWYMAIQYDSDKYDVIRSYESMTGAVNSQGTAISSDSFLIKTDGKYIYSKSSGARAVLFDYGSGAGSTKRFSVSSAASKFTIFGKGKESVVTDGDTYNLTNTLQSGKKYIIANTMVDGSTYIASTNLYSDNKTPRLVAETVETSDTGTLYIKDPEKALVLTAVPSEKNGYFYLVDENGKYLTVYYHRTIDAAGNKGTATSFVALCDLDEYDRIYNQFKYYYSTSNDLCRLHNAGEETTYSDGSKLVTTGYIKTLNTSSSNPRLQVQYYTDDNAVAYMYELQEKEQVEVIDAKPVTQIRVNGRAGSSKDITSSVYNRYYITNGKTEQFLGYVANVKDGYTCEWTSSDTSIATIDPTTGLVTYTGEEGYVTLTLKVNGKDLNGETYNRTVSTTLSTFAGNYVLPENDDPSYPYEGSVRTSKTASNMAGGTSFQESGVTEIELGVTGVPVSQPLDVVIILDHSSSMNGGTMLEDCIDNTQDFALQILDANPNNRVAVATFDSISERYSSFDSKEYTDDFKPGEAGVVTGNGTVSGAFVTPNEETLMMEQIESLITNNISNTNYDYGMKIAYDILAYAKENDGNKNQVVVFMSDGAPNQFNGLGVAPNESAGNAWVTGDENNAELAAYLADTETYPVASLFNTDGDNWYGVAIKTPEGDPTGVPDHKLYKGYETGLGAKVFTIGYAVEDTYGILGRMASTHANHYYAENNLQPAYDEILNQILHTATDAVVTDQMGAQFDVQFASSYEMGNGNTVTLAPAPSFEIGYWTLDNIGNRVAYSLIEKITFTTDPNGVLIGANSSIIGDGIYAKGPSTINGRYVSYDLNTETFTWNIGEINKTEITLKYYACLEGAAKGEREAGTFATNEYARLTYTNFKGTKNCEKMFPVPTLAWEQAAVSYDFYLVNDDGQPINLYGIAVPFTERVTIGREQTKQILLNSNGETTYSLIAADELPEGYELYNPDAFYSVNVASTVSDSSAVISDSTRTTYFRDGSTIDNPNGPVKGVTSFTNTAVSFAVRATQGVVPDTVVIDYGLPVKISVLGNDYVMDGAAITGVAKSVANGAQFNDKGNASGMLSNGGMTDVQMEYGKVSVVNDVDEYGQYYIVYTPTTTEMPVEDVFYYEYKVDDTYYYATVTVIPAANIYYEESFINFIDGDGYEWEDVTDEDGAITGRFQAEDRPGTFSFDIFDADNSYGEDSAYNDSYTYSMGSAKKTTVDKNSVGKEPTATFTFSGTGFDLFSVTNNETGAVQVIVYKDGTTTPFKNFLVNTYYGYAHDEEGGLIPDTESTAGMYQVPVVSRRDLPYGTYNVVIKPLYSYVFDPNYANGYGDYSIYVDSVRIFNPADPDSEIINDAYLKDGEYAPAFSELRNTLIAADDFYEEEIENLQLGYKGSLFFDGNTADSLTDALATYKTQGPNNEVYLGKNQAVAFMVSSRDKESLASLQLGMKVVSGGKTAQVVIMNTSEKFPNNFELSGSHETFKKVNSAVVWNQEYINYDDMANNKYETLYPIVIVNVSDTVISLTTFKWAHTTPPEPGESAVNFMVYDTTPELVTMAMRNAMATAETPEETGTYDTADVAIEWSDESFTEGKEATLKVTTPQAVTGVTVDGINVTDCEIGGNGEKIWTYTFVVKQSGEASFDVILTDYNGDAGEPLKTETIYVEEAEDKPDTDEPGTDDSSEGVESPAEKESFIDKTLRVLSDIFNTVLKYIKSVIDFFWRFFA